MSVRECRKFWLISISNIRLLLVAVPSYYWYPPSHPSVLISSHFWRDSSPPSARPPLQNIPAWRERGRGGEINEGLSWSQTDWLTDWGLQQLISQAELIFLIKYKLGVLLAVTKTSPLLALWDWLNTEELSLILTLLFRQLGYVFISE